MRELIVNTFATLDGVMQAPGGPEEDPSGGFDHGGWSFGYWDELMQGVMGESMSKPFDLVLGRKTYEIFAAFWPHRDDPGAEPLNKATKHVASTTLKELEWENSKLIEGEVPEGVRALKEEDGPQLQVHGSANLIQTLLQHGLVDEFRVDLPARARDGKAPVRRRHGARGPGAHEFAGQLHRSDHRDLSKRGRDQVRLLRRVARRSPATYRVRLPRRPRNAL